MKLTHQFKVLTDFVLDKLTKDTITVDSSKNRPTVGPMPTTTSKGLASDPWGVVPKTPEKRKSGAKESQAGQDPQRVTQTQNVEKTTKSAVGVRGTTTTSQGVKNTSVVEKETRNTAVPSEKVIETWQKSASGKSQGIQNVVKSITKDILSKITAERDGQVKNIVSEKNNSLGLEERVIDTACAVTNLETTNGKNKGEKVKEKDVPEATLQRAGGEKEPNNKAPDQGTEEINVIDIQPEGMIIIEPMDDGDTANDAHTSNVAGNEYTSESPTDSSTCTSKAAQGAQNRQLEIAPSSSCSETDNHKTPTAARSTSFTAETLTPAMIVPIPDTPNGRETWASNTDNVTISIVTKEDGSTELVLQTFKEDKSKDELPWIPAIEPTDLTVSNTHDGPFTLS